MTRREAAVGTLAVVSPFALAAAAIPLRARTPNTTVALVLSLVVTGLAATNSRPVGALAGLAAGLGFDVFHTRPYGSLSMTRAADVQTAALLIGVGVLVGHVAAQSRRNRGQVIESIGGLVRVHGVAEMVASGEPVGEVVLAAAESITSLLGLRSCTFDPSFAASPGPFVERSGRVTWGSLTWASASTGLPSQPITLVIEHQGRPMGRFVLHADPGHLATEWQLRTAVSLADQAGSAIAAQGVPLGA